MRRLRLFLSSPLLSSITCFFLTGPFVCYVASHFFLFLDSIFYPFYFFSLSYFFLSSYFFLFLPHEPLCIFCFSCLLSFRDHCFFIFHSSCSFLPLFLCSSMASNEDETTHKNTPHNDLKNNHGNSNHNYQTDTLDPLYMHPNDNPGLSIPQQHQFPLMVPHHQTFPSIEKQIRVHGRNPNSP